MTSDSFADNTAHTETPTALSVVDLHSYYGSSHVVKGLSFDVAPGEGMAILGRNGAGKSTTMRSLMGLLDKTTGSIRVNGVEMHRQAPHQRARQGLALVFEERRIFPGLTVAQNLGVPSKKTAQPHLALDEIFDMFPLLAGMRDRDGGTLSGGEQQMLAIARAVKARPSVLLLDEPSEGLAPKIVEDLVIRIKTLREQLALAVIVAEHKQWFSREVTETVGVLASESGSMVFHDDWPNFDAQPDITERYLSVGATDD